MKNFNSFAVCNSVIDLLNLECCQYKVIGSQPFELSTENSDIDITIFTESENKLINTIKTMYNVSKEYDCGNKKVIEFYHCDALYSLWIGNTPLSEREVFKKHLRAEVIWDNFTDRQKQLVWQKRLVGIKTYAAIDEVHKEEQVWN